MLLLLLIKWKIQSHEIICTLSRLSCISCLVIILLRLELMIFLEVLGTSTPTTTATLSRTSASSTNTAGGNSALCQSSNNSGIINCGQGNTQTSASLAVVSRRQGLESLLPAFWLRSWRGCILVRFGVLLEESHGMGGGGLKVAWGSMAFIDSCFPRLTCTYLADLKRCEVSLH